MVPQTRATIAVATPRAPVEARITTRGPHQVRHLIEHDATRAPVAIGLRILAERGSEIVAADGARLAEGDGPELARIAQALHAAMAGTARVDTAAGTHLPKGSLSAPSKLRRRSS